jgi:hypothetical protein
VSVLHGEIHEDYENDQSEYERTWLIFESVFSEYKLKTLLLLIFIGVMKKVVWNCA